MAAAVVYFLFALTFFQFSCYCEVLVPAEVIAVFLLEPEIQRDSSGTLILPVDKDVKITLLGNDFSTGTEIAFTSRAADKGANCEEFGQLTKKFRVNLLSNSTLVESLVHFTTETTPGTYFYICMRKEEGGGDISWVHQGQQNLVRLVVSDLDTTFMPIYIQIPVICFLLCLSGLFSGLNLGLMALDKTELKIIERCGSPNEKKYAKVIAPLRKKGNFLLCTLLLGNVLVNNSLTILLDNITNGLIAVIGATVFIVIFGEIVPQALCSRHGLAVGAKTRFITYLFMLLTFPASFPISLLLDKILGEEIGQVYNREKLQELIRVTKDFSALDEGEVNIISGALSLTKKTVVNIMTRIEDVFMLEYNDILNFETMSEIMKRGYSRIPVYEGDKSNIVALLNIKDLALIDPDDNTPLKTVCKFYQHHLIFVFDDHKLDQMLQDFRQGHSHMAIVRRVNNEGDGDPYYETLGVVTLEDVIEEIIQSEIIDETDTLTDNIHKAPRRLPRQDFSVFNQPDDQNRHVLPPQLSMATFQFLSTSVERFLDKYISENVLKKLIKQNVVVELNPQKSEYEYIYREGVPCDYFVLILQGHVEVSIGREGLCFQGGPFTYYGVKALDVKEQILSPTSNSDSIYVKHEQYVPDFTVRATDSLLFLRIKRPQYIVARRATLMARSNKTEMKEEEAFNKEWTALSKINQCNHADNEVTVEVEKDLKEGQKSSPHSDNWTPLPSSTNIHGLNKRTDSKDSGWSFPATEKQTDTSESEHDVSRDTKHDSSCSDIKLDLMESKDSNGMLSSDSKLNSSDHDRTSKNLSEKSVESLANEKPEMACDNTDHHDEELGTGEFTPLVSRKKKTEKRSSASGDS